MPESDAIKSFSEQRSGLHQKLASQLLHYVKKKPKDGEPTLVEEEPPALHKSIETAPTTTLTTEPAVAFGSRIVSIADSDSVVSVRIAARLAEQFESRFGELRVLPKFPGQTYGSLFEAQVTRFLSDTFSSLGHIRPGRWHVKQVTKRDDRLSIAEYEQYAYLKVIDDFAKKNLVLDAALGSDYLVASDVVVVRDRLSDDEINRDAKGNPLHLVDNSVAKRSRLRASAIADAAAIAGEHQPRGSQLLHASVSCKWTIRSDRAQNTRLEARNLSRNRKGNQPHITAVTAEPLPSRLASVALSTGDIDCVYHVALDELLIAFDLLSAELNQSLANSEEATASLRQQADAVMAVDETLRKLRVEKRTLNQNKDEVRVNLQTQIAAVPQDQPAIRQELKQQLRAFGHTHNAQLAGIRAAETAAQQQKAELESTFDKSAYRDAMKNLRESRAQIEQLQSEDKWLQKMVQGNRLRDISDLPLDLAV